MSAIPQRLVSLFLWFVTNNSFRKPDTPLNQFYSLGKYNQPLPDVKEKMPMGRPVSFSHQFLTMIINL